MEEGRVGARQRTVVRKPAEPASSEHGSDPLQLLQEGPIALRREPKPYGGAAVQQTRLRERSVDRARREALPLAAGAADTFFVRFI